MFSSNQPRSAKAKGKGCETLNHTQKEFTGNETGLGGTKVKDDSATSISVSSRVNTRYNYWHLHAGKENRPCEVLQEVQDASPKSSLVSLGMGNGFRSNLTSQHLR